VDRAGHHPPRGVLLTESSPGPRRRVWLLLPVAVFLFARLFASRSVASHDNYTFTVGGSTLEVTIDGHSQAASSEDLHFWIENSARGVADYFGHFPVPRANINLRITGGQGVSNGKAMPGVVPTVRIRLGEEASRRTLANDWVLVHEMIHLGFPEVRGPHNWMSEGLATYAEPVARIRNGTVTPEKFWSDLVRDLPQGLPETFDTGFNTTQSWASTYWGGCLFWFLADVQIRQATNNRKGLDDALRALNRDGGNFEKAYPVDDVIQVMDRAVGTPVLRPLYDAWALQRGSVDLDRLWQRLGVIPVRRGQVRFDDTAPLAKTRRAITG
jgi:hypothetical protein